MHIKMEKEIKFIALDYDYFDFKGENYIKIIGRTKDSKKICVIDKFEPYFWAVLKESVKEKRIKEIIEKIEKIEIKSESGLRNSKVEKVELCEKNFLGKKVKALKIYVTNYKDCHAVANFLDYEEIEARREYDISLITRYITERKFTPLTWKKSTGELIEEGELGGISSLDVDFCIRLNKIENVDEESLFSPNILAFDIETDDFEIGKGEILMISLAGKNFNKVLTWKQCKEKQDYVECFKDEEEMLENFVRYVKKINPDLLVGYFSDGFDMPYLRERADKLGVKLSLGVDNKKPVFTRGRISSASISGIVHVDLFRFIETVFSQYLQSETLGLHEVSLELLGEGKKDFDKTKKASKRHEGEWKDFFEYNMQDSLLTLKLAEKLWIDMFEFSRIIQEPLFDITRSGMSQLVEDYILHNLNKFNEIAEKRPLHDEIETRREREKYEGAFVLQPEAGLYNNLAFFDFTSMYSSVIVTFNLSKATFLGNRKEKNAVEADLGGDGKAYFSLEKSFFPLMLSEIIEKRKKYKSEYKKNENNLTKARSNAYKLLANAAYGYQGFFGARYYCREAAAATAALAKKEILETIEKIKKAGFEVIYSDTDSISFLLKNKTKKDVNEFLEKLNKDLPGIMELELEDFYDRAIFVMKRTGESGAKKKYALINDKGKIKIRGFETVRRDWCDLAREIQNQILESILKEGNEKKALEFFKKKVKDLKERKIEKEEIMIRTQLKKPISEYKAITPHVIAAQKMKEAGIPVDIGMLIEYFIAEVRSEKAKKLVREKVKLSDEKGEYNIEYYLTHQIIPAVENIFEVFGINIKEIIAGTKQMKLF